METFTSLTPQQLRRAANVKEKIDALQKKLSRVLGVPSPSPAKAKAAAPTPKRRKQISAAGIARIRAAQKARWAAIKKGKAAPKRKRKLSAAGRARLVALAKARWAKVKAAGKKSL